MDTILERMRAAQKRAKESGESFELSWDDWQAFQKAAEEIAYAALQAEGIKAGVSIHLPSFLGLSVHVADEPPSRVETERGRVLIPAP